MTRCSATNARIDKLFLQLKELTADGLIIRKSYDEMPPRVEYSITDKGKTLLPTLDLICEWGKVILMKTCIA